MGFTGAHVLYTFDAFILALYLLFHGCALLKYTCKHQLTIASNSEFGIYDLRGGSPKNQCTFKILRAMIGGKKFWTIQVLSEGMGDFGPLLAIFVRFGRKWPRLQTDPRSFVDVLFPWPEGDCQNA